MEMLYYYWTRHGIRPSVIYDMPPGERRLVRAFFEFDREEINDTLRSMGGKVFPVCDVTRR